MNNLLQRIADYFAYQYKGNDKTAPKMELSVDDLRSIAALNVEKCKLKTHLRNLQQVKSNADRIRNMSDEELVDLLQSVSSGVGNGNPFISLCVDDNEITMDFSDIYEWLQSEAE